MKELGNEKVKVNGKKGKEKKEDVRELKKMLGMKVKGEID